MPHRPFKVFLSFCSLCFICFLIISVIPWKRNTEIQQKEEQQTDIPHEDKQIIFNQKRFTYNGSTEDISFSHDILTIKKSGEYRLSGTLAEGRIRVDCEDGGHVRLILDGASVNSSYGSAIEAFEATPLTIEATEDTVNILSSAAHKSSDPHIPSTCILARSAIIFSGKGKIIVDSDAECGIVGLTNVKSDIEGLTVNAAKTGILVRDGLSLTGGRLTLKDVTVGVLADGGELSGGRVKILGGTFTALCREIAIFASREISILGGEGSIDSPIQYKCCRTEGNKEIEGVITVASSGFPVKK